MSGHAATQEARLKFMLTSERIGDKKKVLLVEDDADFRALVRMMLSGGDLQMIMVEEGGRAMEAIREHRPDLVILDLMLPDMNGWEIFMAMREEAASAKIPVIILSCVGTRHDRTFGLHVARVHDYLVKPCLPSRLQASVAAALGSRTLVSESRVGALQNRVVALPN